MKQNLLVGIVVKLKTPCLGNPVGTKGVVYETYTLGGRPGSSVIFKNGLYDGFSPDEQERFLETVDVNLAVADYQFKGVMQVCEDFRKGVFDAALGRERCPSSR